MRELTEADVERVAQLFRAWGAEKEQADTMARQLLKRARQISVEQNISELEATESLLSKVVRAREGS